MPHAIPAPHTLSIREWMSVGVVGAVRLGLKSSWESSVLNARDGCTCSTGKEYGREANGARALHRTADERTRTMRTVDVAMLVTAFC